MAIVALLIFRGTNSRFTAQVSAAETSAATSSMSQGSSSPSPASFSAQEPSTPTGVASPSAPTLEPTIAPASAIPTALGTLQPVACIATDQDQYVYHPYRLKVGAACIRVTGVVQAVRHEADGDFHILLAVDAQYNSLLAPANQGVELGDLVVEPICVHGVAQTDAIAVCAADPDPLPPPYPIVGDRVWMEGRYVFDLDHGGWAELHPLYRWGLR